MYWTWINKGAAPVVGVFQQMTINEERRLHVRIVQKVRVHQKEGGFPAVISHNIICRRFVNGRFNLLTQQKGKNKGDECVSGRLH